MCEKEFIMKNIRQSIFHDIYNQPYDDCTRVKLYASSKASLQMIQRMSLLKRLKVHNGCVNSICWNAKGDLILSGSDDRHLVLTNAYNYEVLTDYKTSHRANIFSAKFLPNSEDHHIVSCSGDGTIVYTDLVRGAQSFYNRFTCHSGTTYEIATIPGEPRTFLSCGEDGTVRCFDLRVKYKCVAARCREDVLISCQRAVTALSVNPAFPHQIAIGCSDSTVRIFDRRALGTPATGWTDNSGTVRPLCSFTVPEFDGNSYRITSLSYSPDGQDVLVSYSSDHLYLFSIKDQGSVHLRKDSGIGKGKGKKHPLRSPQVRRLRLRGDWSDTGPDARPEREGGSRNEIAQARRVLRTSLMQRMTDVISRMLNDPATRAALSGGGEDSLESVIEQQESTQRSSDSNIESNEERPNMSEHASHVQVDNIHQATENAQCNNNRLEVVNNEEGESERLDSQQQYESLSLVNSSSNRNVTRTELNNVPTETESSQDGVENMEQGVFDNKHNELQEPSRPVVASSSADIASNQEGNIMENLQDRLTTMRDGFLVRHGSEPAVSLTYSELSTSSATISLGMADEVIRDSYHSGPSGSRSRETIDAGPSNIHDRHLQYPDVPEKDEGSTYVDSDDEDIPTRHRLLNPVEAEMDEAIANARSSQSRETFDETCLTELSVKQKYMGHRNARTMIKEANFWGNDFVMSGSDCGHVFVWERDTARLRMLLEADQHVVNCLQPHPFLPMLATSGIDYDVKLWAPISEESSFDEKFAEDLRKRNAVMLEETKDTITVPAVFMIRMLACLNQIRRGRGRNRRRSGDETDELRGG